MTIARRIRTSIRVLGYFALIPSLGQATEWPSSTVLRVIDPGKSLPENIELLKREHVSTAERSEFLASAVSWWDGNDHDFTGLTAELRIRARAIELAHLTKCRATWRDQLLGLVNRKTARELKDHAAAERRSAIVETLGAEAGAEYLLRNSPEMRRVLEWLRGLESKDSQRLALAAAETERKYHQTKTIERGPGGWSTTPLDVASGEVARVRAFQIYLDEKTAAVALQRADTEFLTWCRVLPGELGLSNEQVFRLFALKRITTLSLLELADTADGKGKVGRDEVIRYANIQAEQIVGTDTKQRYEKHYLGGWLLDSRTSAEAINLVAQPAH